MDRASSFNPYFQGQFKEGRNCYKQKLLIGNVISYKNQIRIWGCLGWTEVTLALAWSI